MEIVRGGGGMGGEVVVVVGERRLRWMVEEEEEEEEYRGISWSWNWNCDDCRCRICGKSRMCLEDAERFMTGRKGKGRGLESVVMGLET